MSPRRRTSGFTLIELLIVVVIIGILAAIAIPKLASTKGKANLSALKSDLRNVAVAQESYFYENQTYTNNLAALNVNTSAGVSITFTTANATGWAATTTHTVASPQTCGIYVGGAPAPLAATTIEGRIACQ